MTSKIILNVNFTDEEKHAFLLTNELLRQIQNQLAETQSTHSIDNGDIIDWYNIALAREVINHYLNDTQFLVR